MPQGGRNRNRGRRNRNRRNRPSLQRLPTNDAESSRNPERRPEELEEPVTSRNEHDDDDDDDDIIDSKKTKDSVVENADPIEGGSSSRRYRIHPDDKCRIEKIEVKELRPGTIEIMTVSSLPLEATVGHIAGVGILETGNGDRTTVTISEPVESIRSFPGYERTELSRANGSRLEIREVDDSDTEVDCQPTIVELESTVERDSIEGPGNFEESKFLNERVGQHHFVAQKKFSKPETESPTSMCATVMPKDVERKLRTFIEGLQLPSFSEEVAEDEGRSLSRDVSRDVFTEESKYAEKTSGVSSRRKTRKRSMSTASHYARSFLDIIQEEGERLSEDEAQHIRDFINEEISKYRREDRLDSAERAMDDTKWDDPEEIERASEELKCDVKIKIEVNQEGDIAELNASDKTSNREEVEENIESSSAQNVANPEMQVTKDVSADEKVDVKDDTLSRESEEIIATQDNPRIEKIDIVKEDAGDVANNKKENIDEAVKAMKSNVTASEVSEAKGNKLLFETLARDSPEERGVSPIAFAETVIEADSSTSPSRTKRPPPLPPRRSSSFGHEPQRPPVLPEIDYISSCANIHELPETRERSSRKIPGSSSSASSSGSSREAVPTIEKSLSRTDLVSKGNAEEVGRSIASSGIRDDDPSCSRDVGTLGVALAGATRTEITRRGEGEASATLLLAAATHDRSAPPSRQEGDAEVLRCFPTHQDDSLKKRSSTIYESSRDDKSDVGPGSSAMGNSSAKSKGRPEREGRKEKSNVFQRITKSEEKSETSRIIERHEKSTSRANQRDFKYSTWESKREERHEEKHEEEETRSSASRRSNARNSSDDEASSQRPDVSASENPSPEGDVQGHDSSGSTASLNTVKHRSLDASLTDLIRETKENNSEKNEGTKEDSPLKRKLTLLKSAEETSSPQPVPYSPVEDLYYLPLSKEVSWEDVREEEASKRPSSLRELCVTRILSMPFGSQMIDEITAPKLNIFESLRTLQRFVNDVPRHNDNARRLKALHGVSDARRRELTKSQDGSELPLRPNDIINAVSDRASVNIELSESSDGEMEERWRALSTTEDPRLLVCLSPSQQASRVRASADTLLDLHRKFLNRYSYREDQPRCVSVPRYRVQIRPTTRKDDDATSKISSSRDTMTESSSCRLLEIIKEERNGGTKTTTENAPDSSGGQESLKVSRPSDRSNLASRDNRSATANELFPAATRGDDKNGHVTDQLRITTSRFNAAPANGSATVRDSERSRSAIIDRSMDVVGKRTPPLRRTTDPGRHVNSALIDDRLEVPPLPKRAVTVDRSCIDTTSIFDQNPPRSHLEPSRRPSRHETDKLKQVAAVEIMDKLKTLQTETLRRRLDGDRRGSLPQEYFVQQLKYIELLEEQLKNVLLAEEEERKAFEEFQTHLRKSSSSVEERTEKKKGSLNCEREIPIRTAEDEQPRNREEKTDERLENNGRRSEKPEIQRERWREKSRNVEKTRTETIDRAGSRQFSRKVSHENGIREEFTESIERKDEQRHVINRGTTGGDARRVSANGTSEETSRNDCEVSNEKETRSRETRRPATLPTNGEAFRQRMYDEYVDKVMERQERKSHKVVKISSREDIGRKSDDGDMSAMAREFIEKARKRLNKYGIDLDETDPEEGEKEDREVGDVINARFLIDGKELRDASGKLPRHLREFLKISTMSEDDAGGE